MSLDGSNSLFTHFGQFLRCNLRILSDSVFDPFIKNLFLGAIFGAILSITLGVTLSITHCIIAIAFRYGLYPTDEKQRRMATAYLLESYIDTPSSSLSGSLWWKEVLPCYTKHLNATNIRKSHNMCSRLFICPFICPFN